MESFYGNGRDINENGGFDANEAGTSLTSAILFCPEAYRNVSPYMGIRSEVPRKQIEVSHDRKCHPNRKLSSNHTN